MTAAILFVTSGMSRAMVLACWLLPVVSVAQQPDSTTRIPPRIDFSLRAYPLTEARHLIALPGVRQRQPFFCRQEYRFEKSTSIPLRIRMGSVEQCDYLERKPLAILPK